MTIYAVFLNSPDEAAWQVLGEKWPDRHFILTDHMAFVAPEGITTTAQIMNAVGMGLEKGLLGVVFELAECNGLNSGDLWEWLRKFQP